MTPDQALVRADVYSMTLSTDKIGSSLFYFTLLHFILYLYTFLFEKINRHKGTGLDPRIEMKIQLLYLRRWQSDWEET